MSISNYGENQLIDHAFSGARYVKLHTGNPGEDCTGNPAGTTSRQSVTVAAASAGATSNTNEIRWDGVGTAETITHVSIWDSATAGNPWWYGALSSSKVLGVGDNAVFAIGDLDFGLD